MAALPLADFVRRGPGCVPALSARLAPACPDGHPLRPAAPQTLGWRRPGWPRRSRRRCRRRTRTSTLCCTPTFCSQVSARGCAAQAAKWQRPAGMAMSGRRAAARVGGARGLQPRGGQQVLACNGVCPLRARTPWAPACGHAHPARRARCAGGSARCPGFRERLLQELRPLVPDDYEARAGRGTGRGRQAERGVPKDCAGSGCVEAGLVVWLAAVQGRSQGRGCAQHQPRPPPISPSPLPTPRSSTSTWLTTRCCAPGRGPRCWRPPHGTRSWR